MGMTRYNNDFGRAQEQYIMGQRINTPSVKSVGLFRKLPVELQDSLVVTCRVTAEIPRITAYARRAAI
jgi:hypothetical protein